MHPNFRTNSLALTCPYMAPIYSFPYPMSSFMSLFISLCTNVPSHQFCNRLITIWGLEREISGGNQPSAEALCQKAFCPMSRADPNIW
jgi:hypothetical protein